MNPVARTWVFFAVGLALFIGLYYLSDYVIFLNRRRLIRNRGGKIAWEIALNRVINSDGYFAISLSHGRRELFFVERPFIGKNLSEIDASDNRVFLVAGYRGAKTVAELNKNGACGKCVEINEDASV